MGDGGGRCDARGDGWRGENGRGDERGDGGAGRCINAGTGPAAALGVDGLEDGMCCVVVERC